MRNPKTELFIANKFLSYLTVAYALITEDLAKYTGKKASEHREEYMQLGKEKFHNLGENGLKQFLKENYPMPNHPQR